MGDKPPIRIEDLTAADVEQLLFQETLESISMPDLVEDLPPLVIIVGPCRTATGALATALNRSEHVAGAHIQPLKTVRRNRYSELAGKGGIEHARSELILPKRGVGIEIIKETLGPTRPADYFNPFAPFLARGYPSRLIRVVATLREPLETYDSWVKMWGPDVVNVSNFNQSYAMTRQILDEATKVGITSVSYAHELIRDSNPAAVLGRLTSQLGIPYTDSILEWGDDGYEATIEYQIPPMKFIEGSVSLKRGGRGGLVWKPHEFHLSETVVEAVSPQLQEALEQYDIIMGKYGV